MPDLLLLPYLRPLIWTYFGNSHFWVGVEGVSFFSFQFYIHYTSFFLEHLISFLMQSSFFQIFIQCAIFHPLCNPFSFLFFGKSDINFTFAYTRYLKMIKVLKCTLEFIVLLELLHPYPLFESLQQVYGPISSSTRKCEFVI